MIIAIGTDIVEVARIKRTLARTPRFVKRVFTPAEQTYCEARGAVVRAQHYAARFAAKEAAFKALGTGWRNGLTWHDVEITRDEQGAPHLLLTAYALRLFQAQHATHLHLSLSHTAEHALAFVVIERN